jgi:hypothetical protein
MLKLLIDGFNNETDRIVNVDGFNAEYQRINSSEEVVEKMIHTVSLLIGFTFINGYKRIQRFVDADGKSLLMRALKIGLKTRLTKLAAYPGCKSVMEIPILARLLIVQW